MIKKYILGVLMALSIPALVAYAATPMLSVSGSGDGSNATVQITGGEINAPVVFFSTAAGQGNIQGTNIGTTDINGNFTGSVNTNALSINGAIPVYVQVGGYQSSSVAWPYTAASTTGGLSFSQMSPTIGVGMNGSVTISGGSGTYYVASNSNASGVSPTIAGNTISFYGAAAGQASVVVCSTGGGCGTITPMIGTTSSTSTNYPTVSASTLNVQQGSQGSITLSGGSAPYTISVPSGSGVSTTLVGNTLYINGNTTGTNTVQVCSANGGNCTPVSVNVWAQGSTIPTTTTGNGNIGFTLPVMMGQPVMVSLTGGIGNYYLQSPVSSPALATISGNSLMLNGSATGSGMVTVCQTGASSCLPINFVVTPALTGTGGGYFYDTDLTVGQTSQDVMELQTRLKDEGYFTVTPTGYFGPLTMSAVMAYQSAHGISSTGYVGPLTRAMLNQ
jgi:hypothetical protein